MSEKLSFQESAKSANAISMYRRDNSENTNKRVIVKKMDRLFLMMRLQKLQEKMIAILN